MNEYYKVKIVLASNVKKKVQFTICFSAELDYLVVPKINVFAVNHLKPVV